MATEFSLEPFSGSPKEDAERWYRRFEDYAQFKGLNTAKKLAAFALLLKGPAADWFYAGHENQDLDQLKTDFLKRFQTSKPQWTRVAEIFRQDQRMEQSVLEYITQMQKLAARVSLPEEHLFHAITRGLIPSIREHMLLKEVKNLQELIAAAPAAEQIASCSRLSADSKADTATLISTIEELREKVEAMSLSHVALMDNVSREQMSNTGVNCSAITGMGTPTEHHLDLQTTGPSYLTTHPLEYGVNHVNVRRMPQPMQRGNGSAFSSKGRRPYIDPRVMYDNRAAEMQGHLFKSPHETLPRPSIPDGREQQFGPFVRSTPCSGCGKYDHIRAHCFARNLACRNCGKIGHIASVCRSVHQGSYHNKTGPQ